MPGVGNGPVATKPRVFVVDDERPLGRVIAAGLGLRARQHRYEVVWDFECPICSGRGCATCTDEQGRVIGRVPYGRFPNYAFERLCTDEEFDLTFLDIGMPDINGMQFFYNLRLRAPARCDRLVFITGAGLIPAVEDFIKKHHTIEKPASLADLEVVVDLYAEKTYTRGPR